MSCDPRSNPAAALPGYRRRKHGKIAVGTREAVYAQDGYQCVRCGSSDDLTCNHIVPHCFGGRSTIDNLETMCMPCNIATWADELARRQAEAAA